MCYIVPAHTVPEVVHTPHIHAIVVCCTQFVFFEIFGTCLGVAFRIWRHRRGGNFKPNGKNEVYIQPLSFLGLFLFSVLFLFILLSSVVTTVVALYWALSFAHRITRVCCCRQGLWE